MNDHPIPRLLERLEDSTSLDPIVREGKRRVHLLLPAGTVRDTLRGTQAGHPLHPFLVQLPLGTWLSAAILDRAHGTEKAARMLVGAGLLATAPAIAAGAADWLGLPEKPSRVGVAHAALNGVAVGLYTASYLRRRGGHGGKGLAVLGLLAVSASGFLGGHLTFHRDR